MCTYSECVHLLLNTGYRVFVICFFRMKFIKPEEVVTENPNCRNKWKWSWLEEVEKGEKIGAWARKLDEPGTVWCLRCLKSFRYENTGVKTLKQHASTASHQNLSKDIKENEVLPGGSQPERRVSILDRTVNMEYLILSFLAENRAPFTMASRIVDLAQQCSRDIPALSRVSLSDNAAGYKTSEGLRHFYQKELADELRETFFSISIDESTSKANQRVLCVLVQFVRCGAAVTEHLDTIELTKQTAEAIANVVLNLLNELKIPLSNITTVYTDSCNVMRGCRAGVFLLLKNKIPHLIDVGGDVCHTLHNAALLFSKHMEKKVEEFMDHLYVDLSEVGHRARYELIAAIMGSHVTAQKRRLDHRWLSIVSLCDELMEELSVLSVFYSVYSSDSEGDVVLNDELANCQLTNEGRRRIVEVLTEMKRQYNRTRNAAASAATRRRRESIAQDLFEDREKFLGIVNFYLAHLTPVEKTVKFLQSQMPLIHAILPQLRSMVRSMCASFLLPAVASKSTLSLDDVKNVDNHRPTVTAPNLPDNTLMTTSCQKSLIACASYLIEKLPFDNAALNAFEGLSPKSQSNVSTPRKLLRLADIVPCNFSLSEKETYKREIQLYASERKKNLPDPKIERLDEYWSKIRDITDPSGESKYPLLVRVAFISLTCFSGPTVEGGFSAMNMTTTDQRSSLSVEALSASLSAQYRSRTHGTSVSQFAARDPKMDAVDPQLLKAMRSAWSRVQERRRRQAMEKDALRKVSTRPMDEKSRARRLMAQKRRSRLQEVIKRLNAKKWRNLRKIPKKQTDEQPTKQMLEPENRNPGVHVPVLSRKTIQINLDSFFVKK